MLQVVWEHVLQRAQPLGLPLARELDLHRRQIRAQQLRQAHEDLVERVQALQGHEGRSAGARPKPRVGLSLSLRSVTCGTIVLGLRGLMVQVAWQAQHRSRSPRSEPAGGRHSDPAPPPGGCSMSADRLYCAELDGPLWSPNVGPALHASEPPPLPLDGAARRTCFSALPGCTMLRGYS